MRALRMTWVDLAFLHWRVDRAQLRPLVPPALEIETHDDFAWIGIVPFRMTGVRPLTVLPVPTATDFPELNVRTYVRHGPAAGVWFFSLDAASWLAVLGARIATGLPYHHARMSERRSGREIVYDSARTTGSAAFRATYAAVGETFYAQPGSLERFLTQRLSLFTMHFGVLRRLDIVHAPWPLRRAEARIDRNSMVAPLGLTLPDEAPHVMYADRLDVTAGWPGPA